MPCIAGILPRPAGEERSTRPARLAHLGLLERTRGRICRRVLTSPAAVFGASCHSALSSWVSGASPYTPSLALRRAPSTRLGLLKLGKYKQPARMTCLHVTNADRARSSCIIACTEPARRELRVPNKDEDGGVPSRCPTRLRYRPWVFGAGYPWFGAAVSRVCGAYPAWSYAWT